MNRALPVAALSAVLALCGCRGRTGVPESGPAEEIDPSGLPMKYKGHNVVLVSFDALQAAHVGALGYWRNTTPTLDGVAGKAFNFSHAYSVASWTVPAS